MGGPADTSTFIEPFLLKGFGPGEEAAASSSFLVEFLQLAD